MRRDAETQTPPDTISARSIAGAQVFKISTVNKHPNPKLHKSDLVAFYDGPLLPWPTTPQFFDLSTPQPPRLHLITDDGLE